MTNASANGMQFFPTGALLRGLVKHFLIIDAPEGRMQTVLPDTSLVAAVRFKGDCIIDGTLAPLAAVSGLRDTARAIGYGRGSSAILAVFTHTGAASFFRAPLDALFNATIPMDVLLGTGHELRLLREQLAEAPHHRERVRIFEDFLLSHLLDVIPDPLVRAAVERIEAAEDGLRMDDLVRHIGLSQSALERRFRRVVGTTPKKFSSIVRLRKVTRLNPSDRDLTSVAYHAGYYDQSHFINDLRKFTGVAPGSFFQHRDAFC